MPENNGDLMDKPVKFTQADQPNAERTNTKKLPYSLIILTAPCLMILQGATGLLALRTGFVAPQIVDRVGFLIFMLMGAPTLAIGAWQYLISNSNLRRHWETKLLAVSAITMMVGLTTFAFVDLARPALLIMGIAEVMLFATVGACVLLIISTVVLLVRIGLSALANR